MVEIALLEPNLGRTCLSSPPSLGDSPIGLSPGAFEPLALARQDHLGIVPGSLGDRAAVDPLGARPRRMDRAARGELAQHDLHLELRERAADAAADAAAERDPRVRAGRLVEEALREEPLGSG